MRGRTLAILLLVALLLRIACGLSSLLTVVFDPLLVVAVLVAVLNKPGQTLLAGLLSGGLKDLWTGGWYGQYSFTHLVVSFVISKVGGLVDLARPFPVAAVLAVSTVAERGLRYALAVAFDRSVGEMQSPVIWILAIIANTILGLALRRLAQRLEGPSR